MEFRRATLQDVSTLARLRSQQLIDEDNEPMNDIGDALKGYFYAGIENNSFIAWLAIKEGEVIATSGLCFYRLPPTYTNPSGEVAYVTNMFTVKEYRRRGIASKLLANILIEARQSKVSIVRLHASSEGKGLYKKYGFEESYDYMALQL
jgi:GNAT superfamily N-acetyltransferase